jgi:hypothetical protein
MTYVTDLKERQRLSRVHRARYWNDPAYRLRKINRAREWQGLPPRETVDEIKTVGPRG